MLTAQQYDDVRPGDRLVLARELQSQMVRVPAGMGATVTGKYGGFKLTCDACVCCGVQARFSRVSRFDVSMPKVIA